MFNKIYGWSTLLMAIVIIIFVLFLPPRPGVADQGDFQRIMDIAGLQETKDTPADTESRFYRYVKAEYAMTSVNPLRFFGIMPTPSILYPVTLAKAACRIIGMTTFNTGMLAVVYSVLYITALWMCLKWIGIARTPVFIFFSLLSLVILMDGNYLVWFNSLYGEPMMIIGLLLFTASILYAAKAGKTGFREILPAFLSAFLFIGSKTQCITALPFVVILLYRTFSPPKTSRFLSKSFRLAFPMMLLLFYTLGIYSLQNKTCGVDTKYNSVFYGILKNSDDPEKDLEMLGLPGDMAVEAGKHAYLPHSEYVKYVPWSDITEKEFNQKINNMMLAQFYLLNPTRLVKGMEYTASQSFQTGTFLGKYKKSDVSEYTPAFNRFTFWSDFRSTYLPKKLWLITSFYVAVLFVSWMEYRKRREDKASCLRIELLWFVMAVGAFQFPLPFIGNGEADTAKQLFLFNFAFDVVVITACTWVFNKLFFSYVEK